MKRIGIALAIAAVIFLGAGSISAQERKAVDKKQAEKKAAMEEESKDGVKGVKKGEDKKAVEKNDDRALEAIKDIYRRLDIGVKIYMDWIGQRGHRDPSTFDKVGYAKQDPSSYREKNNNAFRITRAYIDFRYRINDILSARLTTDVDGQVTPASDSNAAFHIYLKYAYLEAKKDFGPVWISATGGLLETPVVGTIDKLSDYRWISQNYIDQSKNIIGHSMDNSADLGVKASFGVMKYLTLTGSFTNGGGYKKDESNSYKAVTYLAQVNPVRELHLLGFGRNEITDKYDYTGKKAKREYYGYGIVYSTDLIKIGATHVFPYFTTVGIASKFNSAWKYGSAEIYCYPKQRRGAMIIDAFFNFNLGPVVPRAPLLVTGRFVYGLQRATDQKLYTDTEYRKQRTSLLYALGIGWQFNRNVRILLGGEIQQYIIRKKRELRYLESQSAGTDWYNAGGTYAFVGSRDPRDTKRIYVKAEVTF